MKKSLCSLLILVLVGLGCNKLSQLLTFEISNAENITIPATTLLDVPVISPVPVTVNSEESFENNRTKASLVKDVVLKKLTLTITNPTSANFNFLKSIRIYIGTNQSDKVLLASLNDIPMDVSTVELISNNAKLDLYIKSAKYTLYTEISLRSTIGNELTVKAESKFRVTADPL